MARAGLADREIKRGPRRHPRHRVHRAAPPARARPRRRRAAFPDDPRGARRDGCGRLHRPGRRRPAWPTPTGSCAPSSTGCSCVDEQQVHTAARPIPTRSTTWPGCSATATPPRRRPPSSSTRDLRRHQLGVRSIHERVYFRPLLEAFADRERTAQPRGGRRPPAGLRLHRRRAHPGRRARADPGPQPVEPAHAAAAPAAARLAVRRHPIPTSACCMLRNLLTGSQRQTSSSRRSATRPRSRAAAVHAARHQPAARRHRSPATPTSSPACPTPTASRPGRATSWSTGPPTPSSWRRDRGPSSQEALRRWKDRNLLGIAARDVLDEADVAHRRAAT